MASPLVAILPVRRARTMASLPGPASDAIVRVPGNRHKAHRCHDEAGEPSNGVPMSLDEELDATWPGPWWVSAALVVVSLMVAGRSFARLVDGGGWSRVLFHVVVTLIGLGAAAGFAWVARAKWRLRHPPSSPTP